MDWALACLSFMYLWTAARHPFGWLCAAVSQSVWIAYALMIHQPGLISLALLHVVVYTRNYLATRHRGVTP